MQRKHLYNTIIITMYMNVGQWTPIKKIGDKITLIDLQPCVLALNIDVRKA